MNDPSKPTYPSKPLDLKRPAYVIWPEEVRELRREIAHHPELMTRLAAQQDKDIYIQIAEIAAYCEFAYDGTFTQEDMLKLCEMCRKRLEQKRIILILPS